MLKYEIRCKNCNKLLAKMDIDGSCKHIYFLCPRCKKEFEYTYNDLINNRAPREPK